MKIFEQIKNDTEKYDPNEFKSSEYELIYDDGEIKENLVDEVTKVLKKLKKAPLPEGKVVKNDNKVYFIEDDGLIDITEVFNESVADVSYNFSRYMRVNVKCVAEYSELVKVPLNLNKKEASEYAFNHLTTGEKTVSVDCNESLKESHFLEEE